MKALVAGAGGMLGRDVVEALELRRHEVVALSREALDITDSPAVDEVVLLQRPDVVINCAAWTDVDGAEDHEPEAMVVNDTAAAVLAASAEAVGAKYVLPSSDYVFDGTKTEPYVESDPTEAISAYGRSKLAGETSVAVACTRHIIVRTSWLFGAGGRNFVKTMLRIGAEQSEVLVVADQRGCPTYTRHLAGAIVRLAEAEEYGIHHVAASGEATWFDFAAQIFDLAAVDCRVMAGTTEMLARKAPRPSYSVLRSERSGTPVLPDWRDGLSAYLEEIGALPATKGAVSQ